MISVLQSSPMQMLEKKVQQSISIQALPEEQTVSVKSVVLRGVWAALFTLQEADRALQWLASELLNKVLKPLVTSNEPLTVCDSPENDVEGGKEVLRVFFKPPPPARSREAGIVHCLDFVQGNSLSFGLLDPERARDPTAHLSQNDMAHFIHMTCPLLSCIQLPHRLNQAPMPDSRVFQSCLQPLLS